MFEKEINSVAIPDLFHIFPMIFQLTKSAFVKSIFYLKNLSSNKLLNLVAINKVFNIITFSSHSTLLFSFDIFNYLVKAFKNMRILIKIKGGGELSYGLNF